MKITQINQTSKENSSDVRLSSPDRSRATLTCLAGDGDFRLCGDEGNDIGDDLLELEWLSVPSKGATGSLVIPESFF